LRNGCGLENGCSKQNGSREQQPPSDSLCHGWIIAVRLPTGRYKGYPLMPHSTFPILYCRSIGRLHTHR
jgi:hypothetical protein